MDDNQRLKLQDLIKENNVQDNTDNIRTLKHSKLIRDDVDKIQIIINKIN